MGIVAHCRLPHLNGTELHLCQPLHQVLSQDLYVHIQLRVCLHYLYIVYSVHCTSVSMCQDMMYELELLGHTLWQSYRQHRGHYDHEHDLVANCHMSWMMTIPYTCGC